MEGYVSEFVNVDEALKLIGGYKQIYLKLVKAFLENQRDLVQLIQNSLKSNLTEARRLVHSCKGIALNLGAKALYDCASVFEGSILNNDSQEIEENYQKFSNLFKSTYCDLEVIASK